MKIFNKYTALAAIPVMILTSASLYALNDNAPVTADEVPPIVIQVEEHEGRITTLEENDKRQDAQIQQNTNDIQSTNTRVVTVESRVSEVENSKPSPQPQEPQTPAPEEPEAPQPPDLGAPVYLVRAIGLEPWSGNTPEDSKWKYRVTCEKFEGYQKADTIQKIVVKTNTLVLPKDINVEWLNANNICGQYWGGEVLFIGHIVNTWPNL